jgi:hypothetical protein
VGLIGSNHEPGRRGFGSEACDAKARMPKQLFAVRSVVASFLLRFWHQSLAQRFPTPKSLATEMARHMARPNGAPMPSGCAGGSFASRAEVCVVVCSSRSDALYMERVPSMVMWQKSPQSTVGTRGRVISPCV